MMVELYVDMMMLMVLAQYWVANYLMMSIVGGLDRRRLAKFASSGVPSPFGSILNPQAQTTKEAATAAALTEGPLSGSWARLA